MDYTTTIEIRVSGAEAADETYIRETCDKMMDYLSFEGEHVEIGVGMTAADEDRV